MASPISPSNAPTPVGTVLNASKQLPNRVSMLGDGSIAFSEPQIAKWSHTTTNTVTAPTVPASAGTAAMKPPTSSTPHPIEYAFQILGIAAAIIFGVWSIKSYDAANTANHLSSHSISLAADANNIAETSLQQTIYQNQLGLLSFCAGNTDARFNETCAAVLEFMAPSATATLSGGLARITAAIGITTPTGVPSSSVSGPSAPNRAQPELPFGAIIGIILGIVAIAGAFGWILLRENRSTCSSRRHRVDTKDGGLRVKA
ncbi:hypothetical protein DFH08DRAFT_813053 [Mycena albidolilacea]|uniref:Uncharacterized protein n=1 Tax=Mycena albidolilacea TaxID=1033008 RepID=A0AAD6ZSA3_9AGAR|nr:hypothetical protein DFH08DRAFT_813053 [Mycena albidolilacea]